MSLLATDVSCLLPWGRTRSTVSPGCFGDGPAVCWCSSDRLRVAWWGCRSRWWVSGCVRTWWGTLVSSWEVALERGWTAEEEDKRSCWPHRWIWHGAERRWAAASRSSSDPCTACCSRCGCCVISQPSEGRARPGLRTDTHRPRWPPRGGRATALSCGPKGCSCAGSWSWWRTDGSCLTAWLRYSLRGRSCCRARWSGERTEVGCD